MWHLYVLSLVWWSTKVQPWNATPKHWHDIHSLTRGSMWKTTEQKKAAGPDVVRVKADCGQPTQALDLMGKLLLDPGPLALTMQQAT